MDSGDKIMKLNDIARQKRQNPYKVLDEKLGFNSENVYNQVKMMLS